MERSRKATRKCRRIQEDISTKATQLIHLPRVQSPFCTLSKALLDSTKLNKKAYFKNEKKVIRL